jgi:DNA-binding transcriptional regulator YhcF (GntR family)
MISGNKVSLHHQVARLLKQRIRTGIYQPGAAFPSFRTLCDEFNVSVNVVYRAIRELEEDGIVKTHHGKGIMIADGESCEKAAIFFGFIHPYVSSMGFHRAVLEYVDEAFAKRSNFAVVRSSKDNPALEREIVEHLIANGVKGLIVWPTNADSNGDFFTRLSQTIPVVLVDRRVTGADLPAVILDYQTCGNEIGQTFLKQRKRLLVLMDNLQISSYRDVASGIEDAARTLGRSGDVTIVQLPISQLVSQKTSKADYREIPGLASYVEKLLTDGGYDAVFCTQDEFVDYVMAQTGLMDRFPGVLVGTFRTMSPNDRSMKYSQLKCLEWVANSGEMVLHAADLVQRWVLLRQMPRNTIQIQLKRGRQEPEGDAAINKILVHEG